jgi:quinone-modifying oxidoreductase subunit QmoC
MSDRIVIKPDADFVKEITAAGGESLKKCFQCGTCSVVCSISPEKGTFPRREMIWAQWGLKDKLAADPNVWLCHQCNDCSTYCPRGAKPGDVLGALRMMQIRSLSFPRFMAKTVNDPKYLVLLLLFPAILLLVSLRLMGTLAIPEGEVEYAKMFSHLFLNIFFTSFVALAGLSFLSGIVKLWKSMAGDKPVNWGNVVTKGFIPAFLDIIKHKKFNDCSTTKWRYIAHLLTLYGFVGLLITTVVAVLYILLGLPYPMAITNPFKIFGNVSAVALFVGVTWVLYRRYQSESDPSPGAMKSGYFDWIFVWVLWFVAVTGIATEVLRLVENANVAYYVYFSHLVFVFFLLVYSPFSKFAHFVYRAVALTYANYDQAETETA